MWELDYKESWAPKNWCLWTVVLGKTLESPLDSKEIQPVHPKGNWSWIFNGRTDAEAETPILWPPDAKTWLIWKDSVAGKDWRQEEKGMTEDERVGWTWVWVNSRTWWRTGKPGMLQSTGSQRVGHDWATELNWTELMEPKDVKRRWPSPRDWAKELGFLLLASWSMASMQWSKHILEKMLYPHSFFSES